MRVTHKPILNIDGGLFHCVAAKHHLMHLCEGENMTLDVDNLHSVMGEAVAHTMRWASDQYKILFKQFNEWTNQFNEYPARRARDLSFYFSPVFASFSTTGNAKAFRQRPRIDDYQPMSNELATLLTMARASNFYDPSSYHWRSA
jgi:hypothetical protein